jgi:hypothetical protein
VKQVLLDASPEGLVSALPFLVAAPLIETQDLLIDEAARAGWAALDQSQQSSLLFWVNTPRFSRRRRVRQSKAVAALPQGTENWDTHRPDALGGLLDGLDALFPGD